MRAGLVARVCLGVLAVPLCAAAQDVTSSQIEPDRPDVTNGTHIVDVGLLQLEFGGIYTHGVDQHAVGTPVTARVGLTEWLEARIGADGLLTQSDAIARATGIGNVQVGAKLRLWSDPGGVPVLSILPTVNLPAASAEKGLGSGTADYTVAVLTGTDFLRHAHLDVNYGIGAIGGGRDAPHFIQHLVSASVSDAVSDNWNPYIELFWFSRQQADGTAATGADLGAIYELGSRFALDGGLELGIGGNARSVAAFGGLSMIVGDILGEHGVHARQRQKHRPAVRPPR